jgi:hypothetical protein
MANLSTIKNWFKTGLRPTEQQFSDTWDSFVHKDDKVPIAQVEGIDGVFDVINKHATDANAHSQLFLDKENASNKSDDPEDFRNEGTRFWTVRAVRRFLLNWWATISFKTINNESILGSGNINISGGSTNIPTLQEVVIAGSQATEQIGAKDFFCNAELPQNALQIGTILAANFNIVYLFMTRMAAQNASKCFGGLRVANISNGQKIGSIEINAANVEKNVIYHFPAKANTPSVCVVPISINGLYADPNGNITLPTTSNVGNIVFTDYTGTIFTNLISANAYTQPFFSTPLTNESYSERTYRFSVPLGTFCLANFCKGININFEFIDTHGYIKGFGENCFAYNIREPFKLVIGDNVILSGGFCEEALDVEFHIGRNLMRVGGGKIFRRANSRYRSSIKSIMGYSPADFEAFKGRIEILGDIGATNGGDFGANFFTGGNGAVIFVRKEKQTSNNGIADGDVQYLINNGVQVRFEL